MTARALLPACALALILGGQLHYQPERMAFWRELRQYAAASDRTAAQRLAYGQGCYDLLEWIGHQTPAAATILLLTARAGGAEATLYHRALYHLYPRTVWWTTAIEPTRYPTWWTRTLLSEAGLRTRAREVRATWMLAEGFSVAPVAGPARAFDDRTWLIELEKP